MRLPVLFAFPALLLAVGIVATSLDPQRAERQRWQEFAASAKVNSRIQKDRLAAESALAESRYDSGACVLSEVPLAPGMVVRNLNPGAAVCDGSGTTAVVGADGTLSDFARTSNTEVIRRFLGW